MLLAAGSGRRLGLGVPKALCLLDGVPLLAWAAGALRDSGMIDQLVVVAPAGAMPAAREVLDACLPGHHALLVDGAGSRHGSLHRGLAALDRRVRTVVVHDASRPLAPVDLVVRVLAAVRGGADLAVPVVALSETVKELDASGLVARTVSREALVRLQTPQAVRRELLAGAHADCSVAQVVADEGGPLAPGTRMSTVDGDEDGFPVVWPGDLAYAEAVLASRRVAR